MEPRLFDANGNPVAGTKQSVGFMADIKSPKKPKEVSSYEDCWQDKKK